MTHLMIFSCQRVVQKEYEWKLQTAVAANNIGNVAKYDFVCVLDICQEKCD